MKRRMLTLKGLLVTLAGKQQNPRLKSRTLKQVERKDEEGDADTESCDSYTCRKAVESKDEEGDTDTESCDSYTCRKAVESKDEEGDTDTESSYSYICKTAVESNIEGGMLTLKALMSYTCREAVESKDEEGDADTERSELEAKTVIGSKKRGRKPKSQQNTSLNDGIQPGSVVIDVSLFQRCA